MEPVVRHPLSVDTRAPGGKTNAYVVGTSEAVLIDPATRSPALDRAVADRGVAEIVLTHTHPDHVGALAEYATRTDATIRAHTEYVDRFVEATGVEPDATIDDNTHIAAGDRNLTVHETPGHAPNHLAFALDGSADGMGGTVVGDLAVARGSVAVAAGDGDLVSYLDSLRALKELDPERLWPGHGPVIDDPHGTIDRLIEHRLAREKRVWRAVENGARTLTSITDAAYEKDVSAVRELAEGTVGAHLEKLASEGELVWDGKRAEPV